MTGIILSIIMVVYSISISQPLQAGMRSWTWPAAGIGMLVGGVGAGLVSSDLRKQIEREIM